MSAACTCSDGDGMLAGDPAAVDPPSTDPGCPVHGAEILVVPESDFSTEAPSREISFLRCPQCGGELEVTLKGTIIGPDRNTASCGLCGWSGGAVRRRSPATDRLLRQLVSRAAAGDLEAVAEIPGRVVTVCQAAHRLAPLTVEERDAVHDLVDEVLEGQEISLEISEGVAVDQAVEVDDIVAAVNRGPGRPRLYVRRDGTHWIASPAGGFEPATDVDDLFAVALAAVVKAVLEEDRELPVEAEAEVPE